MKKIAVFASGNGTNTQNLATYFKLKGSAKVSLVVCNKPDAPVVAMAQKMRIQVALISNRTLANAELLLQTLKSEQIDFIVLAGFLRPLPSLIINAYPYAVVNLHPSLLPKFGGKGMYGTKVHEAVLAAQETESGITVHYVDEHYDNGKIFAQKTVNIVEGETVQSLRAKISQLEMTEFPLIIENLVTV